MNPLSRVYARVARLRRAWYTAHPYRQRQLAAPVISVGNLVVGGSGKTPVVAALARLLLEAGERPAILSRGYGRRIATDGVVVVSDGRSVLVPTPASGDEPQMLARQLPGVPVLVCSDRYLAGRLAERRFAATVHLLDDGFQHLPLARDVDLVLMAAADVRERVLPLGRLRESIQAAAAADAVLVTAPSSFADGVDDDAADTSLVAAAVPHERLFSVRMHSSPLTTIEGAPSVAPGRHAVAVAGIARPERFFAALRARGFEIARTLTFGDHHWFSAADLAAIAREARDSQADIVVTTEKDAVRFDAGMLTAGVSADPPWAVLPVVARVEPADLFAPWLLQRLASARARRRPEVA